MQTNANWRLVEGTANSSLGSLCYHPHSQYGSLDTLQPLATASSSPLLSPLVVFLVRSPPFQRSSLASPPERSLHDPYIGCPNFPVFLILATLGGLPPAWRVFSFNQMKDRVKYAIKNAKWYSFLRPGQQVKTDIPSSSKALSYVNNLLHFPTAIVTNVIKL